MAIPVAEISSLLGTEIGVTDWFEIDQDRVNLFADATLDHQFIHVDPEAAARDFAYLVLGPLLDEAMFEPDRPVDARRVEAWARSGAATWWASMT